jgi:ATP-binding cassette, subfamily B, multidrug efflux pump
MSQDWERTKGLQRGTGMERGGRGFGRHEKPKNMAQATRRLFAYLAAAKWGLVLAIILVATSSLAGIAGTYILKPLINNLINGASAQDLLSGIIKMGLVYLLSVSCAYGGSLTMIFIGQRTVYRIRNELFSHMQDLPLSYFDQRTHGELMSRYTNDVDTIQMALEMALPQAVTSALTVVGVFIMMLVISPLLTVLVVLMLIVMLFAIKFIASRSARYFKMQQRAIGELNGLIEETMIGQKVIKVFTHENYAKAEFGVKNQELRRAATNAQTFSGILMPIMGNLSYVLYALCAMSGAIMTINGMLDVGSIAAFLQFTRQFSQPVTQIATQFNNLMAALAGAERIFDVLDQPVEVDGGTVHLIKAAVDSQGNLAETNGKQSDEKAEQVWAWKIPAAKGGFELRQLRGDVRFESVTFGYVPEKGVLKSISLFAKPGQKIAFVGSTGAGKTTITNLINRFYEIQGGDITYDGIRLKDIYKSDLRRAMGMVLQDVHLFEGTIKDNIRYGKLDATDDEVIQAAKLANAHNFIMKLPNGYSTMLTQDGANLSQGQRQLLSIARAAVADPPVLILDEATSSVDTRTEKQIERGMDQLMNGRTTLAIAHRLSTVRNANAIMVLENGEIIERGDHYDLLDQRGRYYQLYTGVTELD